MGVLSNKIEVWELKAGDHIYTYRKSCYYLYPHHGVYVGGDTVIHFMGDTRFLTIISNPNTLNTPCEICGYDDTSIGVITSCLKCFLKGGTLRRFAYGIKPFEKLASIRGMCTKTPSNPIHEILLRAHFFALKKSFGTYDILHNNCMHFCYYCKTGKIKNSSSETPLDISEIETNISKILYRKTNFFIKGCYKLAYYLVDRHSRTKGDEQKYHIQTKPLKHTSSLNTYSSKIYNV